MRARSAHLAALLVFVLLLSGCIRAEVAIRVNDDGSGTVSVLMALDASLMEALGDEDGALGGGFDADTPFGDLEQADLPAGATLEPYEEGDFTGMRVTVPFEEGDDVARSIEEVFASIGDGTDEFTGEDGMFERLVLRRDGDGWRFEAEVGALADGDEDAASDLLSEELVALLFKDASFRVHLRLPGDVTEHNADEVTGDGDLTWNLDLFSDQPSTLSARSTVGGDGVGLVPVVSIVVGVIVTLVAAAVGAGWVVARRSDQRA